MMNKTKRPRFYAAIAVATVMLLGSCDAIADFLGSGPIAEFLGTGADESVDESANGGGGGDNGTPVAGNTVSFDNPNILIGIGEKVRLIPAITPATAWASTLPGIATVDANGTVTGVAEGTVKITVNSKDASVVVVPAGNVITIINKDEWDKAFTTTISQSGGASYILNIQDNFGVEGTESEATFNGENKKVRLTGTGTVSLSSSSKGSIVRAKANQTFIIDGPTLVGMNANDKAVVYVDGGGSAELRSGAISGNTTSSSNGGGGVYVTSGMFTMNDGVISGNTAVNQYGDGGGVYIIDNGTFTMNGGKISGNTATEYGGGVYNAGGTFTMSGGTIYGSNDDPTLKNTAVNKGAAVYSNNGSVNIESTIYKYPQ